MGASELTAVGAAWPDLRVSVNCSARDVGDPSFAARVASALKGAGVAGQRLTLEVNETAVVSDRQLAARTLNELSSLGIDLSIDDFGTGHSSISRLHAPPMDARRAEGPDEGRCDPSADAMLSEGLVTRCRHSDQMSGPSQSDPHVRPTVRRGARFLLAAQPDRRLIELASEGSRAAFEEIVRRYRSDMVRYGRRLAGDAAEDAVQQALVNVHRALPRIGPDVDLRAWLFAVTHNAAIDVVRRRGPSTAPLDEQLDGVERPHEALMRREALRELVTGLETLPPRQRTALLLRELEGKGHEDIARVLGVKDGAARQLIHRARSALRSAASLLIPPGLTDRLLGPAAGEQSARLAEVATGGAGLGLAVAKGSAAVLATGALVAGGFQLTDRPSVAGRTDATATPRAGAGPARLVSNDRGTHGRREDRHQPPDASGSFVRIERRAVASPRPVRQALERESASTGSADAPKEESRGSDESPMHAPESGDLARPPVADGPPEDPESDVPERPVDPPPEAEVAEAEEVDGVDSSEPVAEPAEAGGTSDEAPDDSTDD